MENICYSKYIDITWIQPVTWNTRKEKETHLGEKSKLLVVGGGWGLTFVPPNGCFIVILFDALHLQTYASW